MPALVLAAALAVVPASPSAAALAPAPMTASADACAGINVEQATTVPGADVHPLGSEPPSMRMHAVLREIGGCAFVDVRVIRSGAQVWEYKPAGRAMAGDFTPIGASGR